MSEDEIYKRVFTGILDFVSNRARTVFEIERKINALLKYVSSEEVIQSVRVKVIDKLNQLELLNDFQYAKDYLNEKVNSSRPVGPEAVKKFLYRKGVSSEIIKSVVSDFSEQDEKEAIEKLLIRKMRTLTKRDIKNKNRITKFLLYKGFTPKVVFPTVDTKFEVK